MNVKKELSIDIIKIWLMTNNKQQNNEINDFLEKLDSFDLNNYIKAIKFDQLKVPYVPFYKVRTKNYFGIEEMKKERYYLSQKMIFLCVVICLWKIWLKT